MKGSLSQGQNAFSDGSDPSSRRRKGGRRICSLVAASAVAVSGAAAVPAAATLSGPGVDPGESISVFHNLDFVAISGYPVGTEVTVDVIRDEVVIGTVTAPAVTTPEGSGLEINHGPEGAPGPGDCWAGHTPDIRPGDRIVVSSAGDVDEITVDDITFLQGDNNPFEDTVAGPDGGPATDVGGDAEPDGDIVVRGVAKLADGTPIPVADLAQSAEFRAGQFRGAPDVVEATGAPGSGEFTMRYYPPYELARDRDGLAFDDRKDALLGNGHAIGVGHIEPVPPEVQLVDGIADLPGPAAGCEQVAPASQDAVLDTDPQTINATNVNGAGDLVISGVSFNATSVSVVVPGLAAPLTTVPTPAASATAPVPQTWTASVPMADLVAVPDGELALDVTATRLAADGTESAIDGTGRTLLKDVVAPAAAPTASPAGGTYNNSQQVSLNAGANTVFYTVDGTTPSPTNGQKYGGPIAITASQTLRAAAVDAAGNIGPVRTAEFVINLPEAPGTPDIVNVREGNGRALVRWTSPTFTGNAALTGFVVRAVGADGQVVERTVSGGARTAAWVNGLTKGVSYRFEVQAINAGGFSGPASAPSRAVVLLTRPGQPSIRVATPRRRGAMVRWRGPSDDGGTSITRYIIRAYRGSSLVRTVRVGPNRTHAAVGRLRNGTRYRFAVIARNSQGRGRISARSNQVRPRTVPARPRIRRARSGARGGRDTARAAWLRPRNNGGARITGYQVQALRLRANGSVASRRWSSIRAPRARAATMRLRAGTYRFRVRAFNEAGRSRWSPRSNRVRSR